MKLCRFLAILAFVSPSLVGQAVPGSIQRASNFFADVLSYPGCDRTGVADSTACIQAAINGNIGKGVRFPSGSYTFGQITIPGDGITIQCDANATTLNRNLTATIPSGQGWIDVPARNNIAINGCIFDGGVTSSTGVDRSVHTSSVDTYLTGNTSIWVHGGSGFTFKSTIQHSAGYPLILDASSSTILNAVFDGCAFQDNREFLYGTGGDLTYGSWQGGIFVYSSGAYYVDGLKVVDCTFQRNSGHGIFFDAVNGNSVLNRHIVISNNHFRVNGLDGIELSGINGCAVTGNTMNRGGFIASSDTDNAGTPKWYNGSYGSIPAVGIDHASLVINCTESDNTLTLVNGGGFDLDGLGQSALNGNSVSNPMPGDAEYDSGTASAMGPAVYGGVTTAGENYSYGFNTGNTNNTAQGGSGNIFTGNHTRCMGGGGIRLYGARNTHVEGNIIEACGNTNATTDHNFYLPITLGTTGTGPNQRAQNVIITKNKIIFTGTPGIYAVQEDSSYGAFSSTDTNEVYDNDLVGNLAPFLKDSGTSSLAAGEGQINQSGLTTNTFKHCNASNGSTSFNCMTTQAETVSNSTQLKIYKDIHGVAPSRQVASIADTGIMYAVGFNVLPLNNWSQAITPTISTGSTTTTISPCPPGVNGANTNFYVHLSGGGAGDEAALVTGGTCVSGADSGTLTFTSANARSTGWTIGSASTGIQESIVLAAVSGPGTVTLGAANYQVWAPVTIAARVSLVGQGQEVTTIQNMATATGAIRFIGNGIESPIAGTKLGGFTVYAGAYSGNLAGNTANADAIYVQDAWDGLVVENIMIRNHTTGIHVVNGYRNNYRNIAVWYYNQYGIEVDSDGNVGSGAGGDIFLDTIEVNNNAISTTPASTSCAYTFPNWSGIYGHHLVSNDAITGLCLIPRAPYGVETSTGIYYGGISDSFFDQSQTTGIRVDGTYGLSNAIEFTHVYASFSGCGNGANCISSAFANAAHGWWFTGTGGFVPKNIKLIGCEARENGGDGVHVDAGNLIRITNSSLIANSQSSDDSYDGLHISNGVSDISMNDSLAGDVDSILSRRQRYGVWLGTSLSNINLHDNWLNVNVGGPIFGLVPTYTNVSGNYPTTEVPVDLHNILFANLPTAPTAGWEVYVTDAKETTPCVGGGGGAWAKFDGTLWNCGPVNKWYNTPVGADVASTANLTPTGQLFTITGTSAINNFTLPTNFVAGTMCTIAGGAWSTTTSGNIGVAMIAIQPYTYCWVYHSGLAKWYPQGNFSAGTFTDINIAPTGTTPFSGSANSTLFSINGSFLPLTLGADLLLASFGSYTTNETHLGIHAYRQVAGTGWTTTALALSMDVDSTAYAGGAYITLSGNGLVGIGMWPTTYQLEVNGVAEASNGFYTGSSLWNAVNVPNGGISAGNTILSGGAAILQGGSLPGSNYGALLAFNAQNVAGTYTALLTGDRSAYWELSNGGAKLVVTPATQTVGVAVGGLPAPVTAFNSDVNGHITLAGPLTTNDSGSLSLNAPYGTVNGLYGTFNGTTAFTLQVLNGGGAYITGGVNAASYSVSGTAGVSGTEVCNITGLTYISSVDFTAKTVGTTTTNVCTSLPAYGFTNGIRTN